MGANPRGALVGPRLAERAILLTAAVFVVMATWNAPQADLAYSRLATVYSLAHQGSFYLDIPDDGAPNPFLYSTIDKVMVRGERTGPGIRNGHIISSKPPMLSVLMTGEYELMHAFLGMDLRNPNHVKPILYVMCVTLVGGGYLLTLLLFARTVKWIAGPSASVLLLAALAFGTLLWGYSIKFNNHIPAAAMLMLVLYQGIGIGIGQLEATRLRLFLMGFSAAMVLAFDMPSAIYAAAVCLWVLGKHPSRSALWGIAGASMPLALHFGLTYAVTGNLLPVQMHEYTYLYPLSYWRHPTGIDALNEPKGTYLFNLTLGNCGLFVLSPVLMAGVAAAIRAAFSKNALYRAPLLGALVCFAVLTAYYVTDTNNYGGEAYGFRWYLVSIPVLMLMAAPLVGTIRKPWQWTGLLILLAISFFSGWESTQVGWRSGLEWPNRFLEKR